jgi:DNA-directed RNA polymerase sigma subunit (sigma70/sigma32)
MINDTNRFEHMLEGYDSTRTAKLRSIFAASKKALETLRSFFPDDSCEVREMDLMIQHFEKRSRLLRVIHDALLLVDTIEADATELMTDKLKDDVELANGKIGLAETALREAEVMRRVIGEGGKVSTVADAVGLSQTRVRQIVMKVYRKMRFYMATRQAEEGASEKEQEG